MGKRDIGGGKVSFDFEFGGRIVVVLCFVGRVGCSLGWVIEWVLWVGDFLGCCRRRMVDLGLVRVLV